MRGAVIRVKMAWTAIPVFPLRGDRTRREAGASRELLTAWAQGSGFDGLSRCSFRLANDIEFSGERKRVRCNEGLGGNRAEDVAAGGEKECRTPGEAKTPADEEGFEVRRRQPSLREPLE